VRKAPTCVLLDTNVYIVGAATESGPEAKILDWLGFFGESDSTPIVEIVVSDALFKQIRHVARRVRNKDWAGELVAKIWGNLWVRYVLVEGDEALAEIVPEAIPSEDIEIYLTAKLGQAQCLVSSNHEFIQSLSAETRAFECLTPEAFVAKYLPT
jgi:hypothetical protein